MNEETARANVQGAYLGWGVGRRVAQEPSRAGLWLRAQRGVWHTARPRPRCRRSALALLGAVAVASTPASSGAQSDVAFPPATYAARRAALTRLTGDAAIVVPGRYMVSPGDEPIKQDPNFWYLTGVESPFAVLLMVPEHGTAGSSVGALRWHSYLFLPERFQFAGGQFPMADSRFRDAPWNRPPARLFPGETAQRVTGVDAVFPIDSFVPRFRELAADSKTLFVPIDGALYAPPGLGELSPFADEFAARLAAIAPNAERKDLSPLIGRLRAVKDSLEVAALRQAAKVSGDGMIEMMRAVRPGMNDREVAGLMEYVWKREGSPRASFTPIVSSGTDAMTLFTLQRERYNAVNRVMRAGDLLFVDYGAAEWMMYGSDLCRTVPVSGRFTPQQRKYYDIVLEAQEAAIAAVQPGVMMVDVIKAAARVFQAHGLEPNEDIDRMGIDHVWGIMPSPTHYLTRNAGVTRYSAAGFGVRDLGHAVGLEATDGRDWSRPLEAGMVITVEPKLYIPDEQIAIMIEDEILVTPSGHENLSAHVPKRAADVERAMAAGRRTGSTRR
ncbi:MAG: Xaa-Pro peptidase family protein [Gemmatimonadaceae bacterium]